MKSSATRQKARLPVALTSLNNGHNFDLHGCYVGMRSLSRPNMVPTRPLRPRNTAWWSSIVANLNNTASGSMLAIGVEARVVACHYHMAMTTLVRNLIWICNSSMLSHYTSSFSVSPSLTSKPVKCRLSLCSSCLGASTRVSIAWLTTWGTFLAITVVHLGSCANVALAVIAIAASCSIN